MPKTVQWNPEPAVETRRWIRCRAHPEMWKIAAAVAKAYKLTMPLAWELCLNFAYWNQTPEQVIKSMFFAAGRCSSDARIIINPDTGEVEVWEPPSEVENEG